MAPAGRAAAPGGAEPGASGGLSGGWLQGDGVADGLQPGNQAAGLLFQVEAAGLRRRDDARWDGALLGGGGAREPAAAPGRLGTGGILPAGGGRVRWSVAEEGRRGMSPGTGR